MKVGIIGAGASGLLCALHLLANSNDIEVDIYEKEDRVGKKLLQTGNGKCNFLNASLNPTFYNDQEFVKNIFKDYSYNQLKEYFEKLGIISYEDEQGRVYPLSNSSASFLEILLSKLGKANIHTNTTISSVKRAKNGYLLNDKHEEDIVVIASGSPAHLKEYNYDIFKCLDLEVEPFSPRLVPINVKEKNLKTLEGLRIKGKVSVLNDNRVTYSSEGEILFKDKGLSGIVVFSASRYLQNGSKIVIDLVPNIDEKSLQKQLNNSKSIYEFLLVYLPKQFAKVIEGITTKENVIKTIKNWKFDFNGFGEMINAQIARGGIKVNQLDEHMQIKKHPGIFTMGEVNNIDGECGGFNLSFAWASALLTSSYILSIKSSNIID